MCTDRVSLPQNSLLCSQNRAMADLPAIAEAPGLLDVAPPKCARKAKTGRPRKDPTGDDLDRLNVRMPRRLKAAAIAKASKHGMTLTDYLAALIAADMPDETTQDVPGIQEVLPRSA